MYTVFLQPEPTPHAIPKPRATGMGYNQFIEEFDAICDEHLRKRKARAFAFVFYDMTGGNVRKALKNERGFEILNAALGTDLTLFYLHHSADPYQIESFNSHFLNALNIPEGQVSAPCLILFRVHNGDIEDVAVNQIDPVTEEPHLIVEQLRRDIDDYLSEMKQQGDLSGLTWVSKALFVMGLKNVHHLPF